MTTVSEPPNLDVRIVAAFEQTATSEVVSALIEEVQVAAKEACESADAARTRALDPGLPPAEVAAARHEMEDGAFIKDRMEVATTRLTERLREVRHIEEDRRRRAIYDDVIAKRDELAEELAREYPVLVDRLTGLLSRVAANNERVERVNARGLPTGAERIRVAELVARNLGGFAKKGVEAPSIVRSVRLPAFQFDRHAAFAWPRSTDKLSARSAGSLAPASP
jgi:hypothetical protein